MLGPVDEFLQLAFQLQLHNVMASGINNNVVIIEVQAILYVSFDAKYMPATEPCWERIIVQHFGGVVSLDNGQVSSDDTYLYDKVAAILVGSQFVQ